MKGLHEITPALRYGWAPYLTNEIVYGRDMCGSLLDRWSENDHPYGLWRWDRGANATGQVYVISVEDDQYYFRYGDTERREYATTFRHTRENVEGDQITALEWWVGRGYVPNQENRVGNAIINGAPEMSYETVMAVRLPDGCARGEHNWENDDGYLYCLDCEVEQ